MHTSIKRVEAAIWALQNGKMVILADHPDRENEGDLIMPAECITPAAMNFMIRNGTGIVCLSATSELLHKLELPLMVPENENTSCKGTPFTVTFDARQRITTGVSAADRAQTILAAISDDATPSDLVKPGHIFPLRARSGGVLERDGHTEGSVDLARIAGFKPAAVICEIMNPDGTMTSGKQLEDFAAQHDLCCLSIDDVIAYRLATENLIDEEASSQVQLEKYGKFDITVVREKLTKKEHVILTKPSKDPSLPTLVRIHSSCATGDIFSSRRCDCNKQLHYALQHVSEQGGMIIYLNQEGRGIGLFNKVKCYALQDGGMDTVQANEHLGLPVDARSYHVAANLLRNRGIENVRLLTNNPAKLRDLHRFGVSHVSREPMPVFANQYNQQYLQTKKDKLQHLYNDDLLYTAKESLS